MERIRVLIADDHALGTQASFFVKTLPQAHMIQLSGGGV
jgi:hypothetical protein